MLSYEKDKIFVVDGVRLIYGLACDEIFGFVAGGEMALARWHRYGELTSNDGGRPAKERGTRLLLFGR
jgi:hypothetical protein